MSDQTGLPLTSDTIASLSELKRASSKGADIKALAEAFLDTFGGARKLAARAMRDYRSNKPGSQNRVRLITTIIELINKATPKDDVEDPASTMDPESALGALRLLAKDMVNGDQHREDRGPEASAG